MSSEENVVGPGSNETSRSTPVLEPHVLFLKTVGEKLIVEQVGGRHDGARTVIDLLAYKTATELLNEASTLPASFPGLSVEAARSGVWGGWKTTGAYERRYAMQGS